MTYPGGKNGAGVYQRIINLMPPHRVYIEPFLGGGAIMRLKRPAAVNIGIERNPDVLAATSIAINRDRIPSPNVAIRSVSPHLTSADRPTSSVAMLGDSPQNAAAVHSARSSAAQKHPPDSRGRTTRPRSPDMAIVDVRFHFLVEDGIEFLQRYPFEGDELVYCDPPYVRSTRRTPGPVYAFEMTDAQHAALIEAIKRLPCLVMISGYRSKLYAKELSYWNTRAFESMTRGGREATEWVWFNFNEPVALHDYRYLGEGFRERERIKRKMNRWMRRLTSMPILERRALLSALEASGLAIAPTARNGDGRS